MEIESVADRINKSLIIKLITQNIQQNQNLTKKINNPSSYSRNRQKPKTQLDSFYQTYKSNTTQTHQQTFKHSKIHTDSELDQQTLASFHHKNMFHSLKLNNNTKAFKRYQSSNINKTKRQRIKEGTQKTKAQFTRISHQIKKANLKSGLGKKADRYWKQIMWQNKFRKKYFLMTRMKSIAKPLKLEQQIIIQKILEENMKKQQLKIALQNYQPRSVLKQQKILKKIKQNNGFPTLSYEQKAIIT